MHTINNRNDGDVFTEHVYFYLIRFYQSNILEKQHIHAKFPHLLSCKFVALCYKIDRVL